MHMHPPPPTPAELARELAALLAAFDAFMREANWGASALSADTIRQVNEAPARARALLQRVLEQRMPW